MGIGPYAKCNRGDHIRPRRTLRIRTHRDDLIAGPEERCKHGVDILVL